MPNTFLLLFLLWAVCVIDGIDVSGRDPDLMPKLPAWSEAKGAGLLNSERGYPRRNEGTGERRLAEVTKINRKLLQTEDDEEKEEEDADSECALTVGQINQYLNISSRTWLIDDDALEDLNNDLQTLINCTEEGDVVLLDVAESITPASRVIIPRRLTISGAVDDTELKDGVFPAVFNRTTITCPQENEGIFLVRSKGVLLANIFFDSCSFDASEELSGIVEVQSCESEDITDTVRMHHVGFVDNLLIGGVGLLMNSPSCSATELIDVEFRDNECNGLCGAVMSLENTLEDVVIERTTHVREADDFPAILSAPEGSTTTARGLNARDNAGIVIFIEEGRLTLTDSSFVQNSADVTSDNDPFGSCLHLVHSSAEIDGCEFSENESDLGGVMYLRGSSVAVTNCKFENNSAKDGAVFYPNQESRVDITTSVFSSNVAEEDGGVVDAHESHVVVIDSTFSRNSAKVNGGCFWFVKESSLNLTNCRFSKNEAGFGGVISFENNGSCTIQACVFDGNKAKTSGGALYMGRSALTVESCYATRGNATSGGVFFVRESTMQISHSICKDNTARLGGSLYASEQTTVQMVNVTINANSATRDGGGIYVNQESSVAIRNSNFSGNIAGVQGGAILLDSSKLNIAKSNIMNNVGRNGGGLAASNGTEITIFDSFFEGNSAEFGGGLHFISPYQSVDCSKKGGNCTIMALSDTRIQRNSASRAGGGIFVSDLKTVRIRCSKDNSMQSNVSFYSRKQWQSMDVIRSADDLCPSWEGNIAGAYGNAVATYAAFVETVIEDADGPIEISAISEIYVIEDHPSGEKLPNITLKIVDELGEGPAIGLNSADVDAVMSSNGFFTGSITLPLKNGSGVFSDIVGFQSPDTYDIFINLSEKALKTVQFKVKVRSCTVGETEAANKRFCEKCSVATYSFHAEGRAPCLPCPENANCTSIVIRPNKGYWNQFPCSEHIQRCLTRRACDYRYRDQELEQIGALSKNCLDSNDTFKKYEEALCKPGHKGPLCGSCTEGHGRSQSFNCEKCFPGLGNVVLVLLSILMLMGLAGFTTRSNLMSFANLMHKREASSGTPGPSSGPPPEFEELDIMEKYYLGGHTSDHEQGQTGARRIDIRARAARKAELAKWQAVELFKIAVNFVQITAIAIAVNVEWSVILIGLFEAAEFAGGITSEATNRSVDCLVSEDSSIPRSVVSIIIDLLVPAIVVGFFVVFWILMTFRTKQSFRYLLKRSILSALAVFYISYISITKTLVNIHSCIKVHDSKEVMIDHTADYWAVDTSLKCYEGSHAVLSGAVGWPLLFLFSLLFPIVIAITIALNVKKDYEDGWIYDVAGFMYRSYSRNYVFWESIIMLRKAILAVVVVFAYPLKSSMQAVLAVFVLALSLYLQMICRPYRKEFDSLNEMEGVSLLVSLLTFVSSLCFDNDHVPFGIRVTITIAVFVCNIGLFLFFAGFFFIFSAKHLKAVLDREGVRYRAEGGTVHILRVYFFVHLSGTILKGFSRCFKCLVGPRQYDANR